MKVPRWMCMCTAKSLAESLSLQHPATEEKIHLKTVWHGITTQLITEYIALPALFVCLFLIFFLLFFFFLVMFVFFFYEYFKRPIQGDSYKNHLYEQIHAWMVDNWLYLPIFLYLEFSALIWSPVATLVVHQHHILTARN